MDILIINNHDYSKYVISKGYTWSREDLDSEKSTRTKDGVMHRDRITTKRKLQYDVRGMNRELLEQLDDDLSQVTFSVTYTDLHGAQTRNFYCSSFSAAMVNDNDDSYSWEASSFSITEV